MVVYDPEKVKIITSEEEITGFHKEGQLHISCTEKKVEETGQVLKLKNIASKVVQSLNDTEKYYAASETLLPENSRTKRMFSGVLGEVVDTAVEKGEIEGFVLYDVQDLNPLNLLYGVFISGTEYLCELRRDEDNSFVLNIKEKERLWKLDTTLQQKH